MAETPHRTQDLQWLQTSSGRHINQPAAAKWQTRWTHRQMPQTGPAGRWWTWSCRRDCKSARTCSTSAPSDSRGRIGRVRPPDRRTAPSARRVQSHRACSATRGFRRTKRTLSSAEIFPSLSRWRRRRLCGQDHLEPLRHPEAAMYPEHAAAMTQMAAPLRWHPASCLPHLVRRVQTPVFSVAVTSRQLRPVQLTDSVTGQTQCVLRRYPFPIFLAKAYSAASCWNGRLWCNSRGRTRKTVSDKSWALSGIRRMLRRRPTAKERIRLSVGRNCWHRTTWLVYEVRLRSRCDTCPTTGDAIICMQASTASPQSAISIASQCSCRLSLVPGNNTQPQEPIMHILISVQKNEMLKSAKPSAAWWRSGHGASFTINNLRIVWSTCT